jgi:hypothetical protein
MIPDLRVCAPSGTRTPNPLINLWVVCCALLGVFTLLDRHFPSQ